VEVADGACIGFSTPLPGKEGPNEDAMLVASYPGVGTVLAVADGAGGLASGEKASRVALEALQHSLQKAMAGEADLRHGILDGFEAANAAVRELAVGAGTTLIVVEVRVGSVRPYHVGDSEALLTGQRGRLKLQTLSHSPVGYAFAAGMLTEKEALHHEDRHLVSNLLGSDDMHIQVGPVIRLSARDTLVLGSDGLFDNVGSQEIVDLVRKGPLDGCALGLARLASQRMGTPREGHPSKPDDLSFLLYRPKNGPVGGT